MLYLNQDQRDELIEHSKKEVPNEACGILAGKDGQVSKIYRMTNTDKSPATFFMDAREQFRALKQMRELGLEMVGIYHSHVASHAYPSSRDIELAFYPEVSYIIISIQDRNNPTIRSFRIINSRIEEEKVNIT